MKQNINFVGQEMQHNNLPLTLNYDSNRDHLHEQQPQPVNITKHKKNLSVGNPGVSEPPKISTPSMDMFKGNMNGSNVILMDDRMTQHTNFQKKQQAIVFLD